MPNKHFEVVLMEELFVAQELSVVMEEAGKRGFVCSELRADPVADRGKPWVSTEKSTKSMPIIYLTKERRPDALILQGPTDDKYRMFDYRWLP